MRPQSPRSGRARPADRSWAWLVDDAPRAACRSRSRRCSSAARQGSSLGARRAARPRRLGRPLRPRVATPAPRPPRRSGASTRRSGMAASSRAPPDGRPTELQTRGGAGQSSAHQVVGTDVEGTSSVHKVRSRLPSTRRRISRRRSRQSSSDSVRGHGTMASAASSPTLSPTHSADSSAPVRGTCCRSTPNTCWARVNRTLPSPRTR